MNTINQLLKSLGFDEPIADDEDATTSENAVASTSDGQFYIKGENETAEDFLRRLPPSTTLLPRHTDYIAVNSIRNVDGLESFLEKGRKLLKRYKEKYVNNPNEYPHVLLADVLLEKLTLMAIEENFLESRFRLVPPAEKVDDIWLDIVQSTMAGELGINAKISRKTSDYEIRVYMKNFTDKADEARVYKGLCNLKLVYYQIQYKGSFLSKLGIGEGNKFNMAPRLYLRTDSFLTRDDHMGSLYGLKEENESAESFVARLSPLEVFQLESGFISIFPEDNTEARSRVKTVGVLLLETYRCEISMLPVAERTYFTQDLQNKLTQLAVECNFVNGRWIVYATHNVDFLWLKTVQATMNGTLGINATIEKYNENYEFCVITRDFNDEADVMRVLAEMKKIGFRPPFYYKTHLYLKLGILKNNFYGLNSNLHEELTEGHITSYGRVMEESQPPLQGNP